MEIMRHKMEIARLTIGAEVIGVNLAADAVRGVEVENARGSGQRD
jgi:hypothetical protein